MIIKGIAIDPKALGQADLDDETAMPTIDEDGGGTAAQARDSKIGPNNANLFRALTTMEGMEKDAGAAPVGLEMTFVAAKKDKANPGGGAGGEADAKHNLDGDGEDSADEMIDVLMGNAPKNQGNNALETGILIDLENTIEVPVTAAKKVLEDQERSGKVE